MKKVLCFSKGINKRKHIFSSFINNKICFYSIIKSDFQSVIGWGFKKTAQRARDYAAKHNLPYVALEDGFLRSIGLGVEGAQPLSLVVDEVGIYYDARQPSKLEQLISSSEMVSGDERYIKARRCIEVIRQHRLSKYNSAYQDSDVQAAKPKVLVVDQTQGDASVMGAQADSNTFIAMLQKALNSHPNDTIWVKVHPDVVAGKKKGFLFPLPLDNKRLRVYSDRCNPWDFLESQPTVYTVSSLMGFAALMAGCKVHCFGLPFYAGWGLTHDQQFCERRGVTRSLEQVFAAAYFDYARYVDPILEERCDIERIISYIVTQLKIEASQVQGVDLRAISWWKQRWIEDFLSAWRFTRTDNKASVCVGWGARDKAHQYVIEDGFIRSVGLGVHFNRPVSLICDRAGIYYDATRPSDLENLLNNTTCNEWDLSRAEQLVKTLLTHQVTKYNVGLNHVPKLPDNRLIILVPGQVEADASLAYGSAEIKTNLALLEQVRNTNPKAFIIYKPHPDVVAGQRDKGTPLEQSIPDADLVVTNCDMALLLNQVDEVHTMTSLTGFEALLRGKKVVTYGMPFYAGWGLTEDRLECKRRVATHSLLSLVAITLLYYPTYIDPLSRRACSAEQALLRIIQMKQGDIQVKDTRLALLLFAKKVKRWIKQHILRQPIIQ